MFEELQRRNVLLVFFLALITGGIYVPVWFLKQREAINDLNSNESLNDLPFIITIMLCTVSLTLTISLEFIMDPVLHKSVEITTSLLNSVGGIITLVMSFKVRRIFYQHFNEQSSATATFFFTIYYLQYKINKYLETGSIKNAWEVQHAY